SATFRMVFYPTPSLPFPNQYTMNKYINLHVAPSELPNGLDLPLDDIDTLRFFFNLGVRHSRLIRLEQQQQLHPQQQLPQSQVQIVQHQPMFAAAAATPISKMAREAPISSLTSAFSLTSSSCAAPSCSSTSSCSISSLALGEQKTELGEPASNPLISQSELAFSDSFRKEEMRGRSSSDASSVCTNNSSDNGIERDSNTQSKYSSNIAPVLMVSYLNSCIHKAKQSLRKRGISIWTVDEQGRQASSLHLNQFALDIVRIANKNQTKIERLISHSLDCLTEIKHVT
ncbi:hypothetical protein PMAYCL1PPCAC_17045, partial [Pristionchus mayeri]